MVLLIINAIVALITLIWATATVFAITYKLHIRKRDSDRRCDGERGERDNIKIAYSSQTIFKPNEEQMNRAFQVILIAFFSVSLSLDFVTIRLNWF